MYMNSGVITSIPKKVQKKPQNVAFKKKKFGQQIFQKTKVGFEKQILQKEEESGKKIFKKKEEFEKLRFQNKEGFENQIFQFANELTNIVNITKKSFSNLPNNDCNVVEIDSDSDVECVPIASIEDDNSCFIVEQVFGNVEFQAVEDNVMDLIKQEPTIEPEVDPLFCEDFVKSEPVEIKTEKVIYTSPLNAGGKQFASSRARGAGVRLFRCNHCPYTSKYSSIIGQHKWRVHNISGEKAKEDSKTIQPVVDQIFGRLYKCDLCTYTCQTTKVLGIHKFRAHKVKGVKHREEEIRRTYNIRSLTPAKKNIEEVEIKETQKTKNAPYFGVPVIKKCTHCPFKTAWNAALVSHKKRKHFIEPEVPIRKVNAEGRFECELCHRSYTMHCNLIRHMKCCKKRKQLGKPNKSCPYCGKTTNFEFQLRRHIEKKHPYQWEKLKLQKQTTSVHNVQQENSQSIEETKPQVEMNRQALDNNGCSIDKYNCQYCLFQTEDSHILRLHTLLRHMKRKKNGQGGLLKCLFCPERCAYRSRMITHVMNKHCGAWLKLERSTHQSGLNHGDVKRKELNREISSKLKSKFSNNSHHKYQRQIEESNKAIGTTSFCINESNNSQEDVKVEEVSQTEAAKTFCEKCDRFYHTKYFKFHTCKKHIKCGMCSYVSVSPYKVHLHTIKTHMTQRSIKEEHKEEQKPVVKRVSRAEKEFQELSKLETASTGQSSVSEANDEEYVPSTIKKKVNQPKRPRITCNTCKKSFHYNYFKHHRCIKLFKCSSCSYTNVSLNKLKQHRRVYHSNIQSETAPGISDEEKHLNNEIELTCAKPKEKIVESSQNQLSVSNTDEKNISISEIQSEPMIFCKECNSNHNPKYFWKYVCYRQKKRCNLCSFVGSSKEMVALHKKKQHLNKSFHAGNIQPSHKIRCQFCPLLFINVHRLKNHLNLKHTEAQSHTKTKCSTSKPVTKPENLFVHDPRWENEASTSIASEGSSTKLQEKISCRRCLKRYHPVYFPYHKCPVKKISQRENDKETETPPNIGGNHPLSNIDADGSTPPPNIATEGSKPTSKIDLHRSKSQSSKAIEEITPFSNIDTGFTDMVGDRLKCENCKQFFKISAFQGHYCRPILRCQSCPFKTRVKVQMTLHKQSHAMDDSVLTGDSLYQCKSCQKKFVSQAWFIHHKKNECNRKPLHQCSLCKKKFYLKKNLELHMFKHHSDNNDQGQERISPPSIVADMDNESESACPPN